MIFYFTGTGNSLYAARQIAEEGEEVLSIPHEMRRAGELFYADDAVGIVYPVYGHDMPAMVKQFIERAHLDTPYLYLIATYGCMHGNAVELAMEAMEDAGHEPSYISTLIMVDNWLPSFDMNEQRANAPQKHIDESIAAIRSDVLARRKSIEPVSDEDRAVHEHFLSMGLRFEGEAVRDFLHFDDSICTGCGICASVCPAECIALEEGIAIRHAESGFGCNACLACIHACPASAVSLPMGEVNPSARFRNEHVSLRDLAMANG